MENNKLLTLFDALVLYDYNIRVLHWKVKGLDFGTKHALMDEYHSQLNSYTDEVGEMLMMTGRVNMPTLFDVLDNVKHDDNEDYIVIEGNTYYSAKEVIENTEIIFNHLIKIYSDIVSDDSLPSDIISVLEEHLYWLRKESYYKLKSTLQ